MSAKQSVPSEAYFDRNQLVLAFARLAQERGWRVGLGVDPTEPDWPVIYVDTPEGQVSWHLPVADLEVAEWPVYQGTWDGHDVAEKRVRLAKLIKLIAGERLKDR